MAVYTPGSRGTIRGMNAKFDAQEACTKLNDAMKGLGTDEEGLIDVLCSHSSEERQCIKRKYGEVYGQDLVKELDSEVSLDFGKVVLGMMVDAEEFILECINKAICSVSGKSRGGKLLKRLSSFFKEGLGGGEYILIGVLCARTNEDLNAIKAAYEKKYGDKLVDKMATDGNHIPHDVCSFILDMISGERPEEEEVDEELLQEDVQELSASQNEDVLHSLLQERSFLHLRKLFEELMNVCGKTVDGIIGDLQGKISVELRHAYQALVTLVRDGEAVYYADRVKGAIQGAGTNDELLIQVILLRAEIDLLDIMEAYEKKYKEEMAKEVGDDTSGDYKDLLMRILSKPTEEPLEIMAEEEVVQKREQKLVEESLRGEEHKDEEQDLTLTTAEENAEEKSEGKEALEKTIEILPEAEVPVTEVLAEEVRVAETSAEEVPLVEVPGDMEEQEEKEKEASSSGGQTNEEIEVAADEHMEASQVENDEDECTKEQDKEEEATEAAAVEQEVIITEGEPEEEATNVEQALSTEENVVEEKVEENTAEQEEQESVHQESAEEKVLEETANTGEQNEQEGSECVEGSGKEEELAEHDQVATEKLEPGGLEGKLEQASVVEETGSPIVSREL